jgi:hypothetical protein
MNPIKIKRLLKLLFLIVLTVLLEACSSLPPHSVVEPQTQSVGKQGQWEGKLKIEDLKTGKSDKLDFDLASEDDKATRIEISGLLNVSVASVYWNKEKFQLLSHREKKAYVGTSGTKTLESLIQFPLDPVWVSDVLFDKPLNLDWKCEKKSENSANNCKNEKLNLNLSWIEKTETKTYFTFTNETKKVLVLANKIATKVQSQEVLNPINIPSSYKQISF